VHLWSCYREYVRLWWDPTLMHSIVWLDTGALASLGPSAPWEGPLPPIRVSEDSSWWGWQRVWQRTVVA
jgi:hypothetical protein